MTNPFPNVFTTMDFIEMNECNHLILTKCYQLTTHLLPLFNIYFLYSTFVNHYTMSFTLLSKRMLRCIVIFFYTYSYHTYMYIVYHCFFEYVPCFKNAFICRHWWMQWGECYLWIRVWKFLWELCVHLQQWIRTVCKWNKLYRFGPFLFTIHTR